MQSSTSVSEAMASNGRLKVSIPSDKLTRATNSSIDTPTGTLYVSEPFLTPHSKKLKALISFTPRSSHFDPGNAPSVPNEFRGFFALFWISMFIATVQSYVRTYEASGRPIALAFATMFSRDASTLALSDAVLVGSTTFCVIFGKALKRGWINYYSTGVIIQHVFQTLLLVAAVTWTFNRKWPWVQSGFLTLHTLVMIMKCHSYMAINGYLQWVNKTCEKSQRYLQRAVDKPHIGGWEKALQASAANRAKTPSSEESSTTGTPSIMTDANGTVSSYIDPPTAQALRRRLIATSDPSTTVNGNGVTAEILLDTSEPLKHPLSDHPDPVISTLANNISDMESELTSKGKQPTRWPNNITLGNFLDYQLIPTLVYELEYPRTERIRPLYVLEKTVATFGSFALLYTVTAHVILPLVPSRDKSFFRSLLDLSIPFMIAYLLLFYIIFECICNGFAELSRFADRQFYEDWVELNYMGRIRTKVEQAGSFIFATPSTFLTFLLSAAVHELVMIVVTKKFRFYLFLMQMIQIPLITVGRLPVIRRNKALGNVIFWLGLYAGFPLLCVAYCAY